MAGSASLRADIQRSAILRGLNQLLPPSGPILNALARFDPLPSLRGPSADVPPPPRGILAARGVARARPSIVRVLGTACGLGRNSGLTQPVLVTMNSWAPTVPLTYKLPSRTAAAARSQPPPLR